MNLVAAFFVVRRYLPGAGIGHHLSNALAADIALHWLVDRAFGDSTLAICFSDGLTHAMAGNTCDALARNLGSVPYRHFARLAHRGSDTDMAAHAERIDGRRKRIDSILKFMKHW